MSNSKSNTLTGAKLYLALIFIVLVLVLSGCSQVSNQNEGAISNDALSVPLPSALEVLVLDATNLVVDVAIDGRLVPCINLTVDQMNTTFSCDITVALSVGPHALALVYSVIDTISNKVVVTTTSEINVNIVAGQTTLVDFSEVALIYADTDEDGISNLVEFENGTDPADPDDPPKTISVPDFVGLTNAEAKTQIDVIGLVTGSEMLMYSDTVEINRIISQDPASGATVAIGTSVALVISKGAPPPVTVLVPDCRKLVQAECNTLLKTAGLLLGRITRANSVAEVDTVIQTSPLQNTKVAIGTSVNIVISNGPFIIPVPIPDPIPDPILNPPILIQ